MSTLRVKFKAWPKLSLGEENGNTRKRAEGAVKGGQRGEDPSRRSRPMTERRLGNYRGGEKKKVRFFLGGVGSGYSDSGRLHDLTKWGKSK